MVDRETDLRRAVELGTELAHLGEWEQAFPYLIKVGQAETRGFDLPGAFYSALGYCLARFEKKYSKGARLGEHGVRIGFFDSVNFLYLARTYMLAGDRRLAIRALERGLKLHPNDTELLALHYEFGVRRRPVVPLLGRDNPLNVWLGRLRARLLDR